MQCTGNSSCFPRGKRAAIVRGYPALLWVFLCAVFSCVHTNGCDACSFTTYGYGIFNVRTNVCACRTHEGGSGTNKQAYTRVDWEGQTHFRSPRPARGSNPGSSDLNSDSRTTELLPPFVVLVNWPCSFLLLFLSSVLFSSLTLRCVTLPYVTLRYLTLRYLTVFYLILSYLILCYVILSYLNLILSRLVSSRLVSSRLALPCLALPCLTLPCLVLSCLVLSCFILWYLLQS